MEPTSYSSELPATVDGVLPLPGGNRSAGQGANPEGSPEYGILAAMVASCGSRRLYRDVVLRWRGIGMKYLLVVLTIATLTQAIRMQMDIADFATNRSESVLQNMPAIHVRQGIVSLDRPDPYIWRDYATGDPILYVDLSGNFDMPEGQRAPFRLSRTEFQMESKLQGWRAYPLGSFQHLDFDRDLLGKWIDRAAIWSGVVIFVATFPLAIIGNLFIGVLVMAWLKLWQLFSGEDRSCAAIFRLSFVVVTPGLLFNTVFLAFNGYNVSVFYIWVINVVLWCIALRATRRSAIAQAHRESRIAYSATHPWTPDRANPPQVSPGL